MRLRRDPRHEREARRQTGCARPRFTLAIAKRSSGRVRVAPRLLRHSATVSNTPRPRIAWRGGPAPATGTAALAARTPVETVRIVAEPAFHVLAVLDMAEGVMGECDRQLIAAGRMLADADPGAGADPGADAGGGAVCGLAIGLGDDFGPAGADRVMTATGIDPHVYDPEGRVAAILSAIEALAPRHVLFAQTPEGGDIARRVAVRLGERLFAGVEAFEGGRAVRRTDGGRLAQLATLPRLISVMPDAFAAHPGPSHEARPVDAPAAVAPVRHITGGRRLAVDPDTIALEEADFLLSGGNGVTDWDAFAQLAAALGATRAGSRMVCDEGHLPRARQVGASGTLVSAGCYFALGISGAPQHLQGIARVGHVVAVNTDLHAEMIKRADLAIVADAQAVMPALIRLVASRQGGGDD